VGWPTEGTLRRARYLRIMQLREKWAKSAVFWKKLL